MKKTNRLTFSELFLIIRSYCIDIHQNSLYLALMEKYYDHSIDNRQASYELKNFKKRGTLSGNIRTSIQIKDIKELSDSYNTHFKKDFLRCQELKDLLLKIISKYNKQFDVRISPIPINNDTDLSTIIAFMLIIVVSETNDEHSSENIRIISEHFSIESFIKNHCLSDDPDSTKKITNTTYEVLRNLSNSLFENFYTREETILNDTLFSNGLFIDSAADKPLSDWILTGQTINTGESLPLTSYLTANDKNLIVLGEGGIGKTTFLYNCLRIYHDEHKINSIPIFIKLSNCKLLDDHHDTDVIMNEISNLIDKNVNNRIISQKDIIDEFTKSPADNKPQYLLLLDGYNEITSLDKGDTRISVSKEINKLSSFDNVRIILTSRNVNLLDLNENAFFKIQATGITDTKIKEFLGSFLSSNDYSEVIQSVELMDIFKIPLFLKMLSKSYKSDHLVPKSRGAILFNYYNNLINQYNEKNNVDAKNSVTTSLVMHYILDFVIPHLSYKMCADSSFEIKYDQFISVISMCKDEASIASKAKLPLFNRFFNGFHTLQQTASHVSKMDPYDIFLIIKEYFGMVYSDSTDRIYFSHQYIRDYFSAYYIIRNIYIASNGSSDILDISNCLDTIDIIDEEHLSLIKDIVNISSFFTSNTVYSVLNSYKHTAYENSNLIRILSCLNDYDLSGYDFNNLDLRKTNLNNINFYNIVTKQHSTFNKCSLGPTTFSNELHSKCPTNIVLSSDKKYLITFLNDNEYKEIMIWDFKTNKSIYSYNFIHNEPIIDADFIDQLLLISIGYTIFSINKVILFDTITENDYIIPPYQNKYLITSVSYCASTKRIYIIFDNKYLSMYRRAEHIQFCDHLTLSDEFVSRLTFNPYVTYQNSIIQNTTDILLGTTSYQNIEASFTINPDCIIKKIIPINSEELLYIEGDCYYPYVHTYDGKITDLENHIPDINEKSIHVSPNIQKILDSILDYKRQYISFFIYNMETKKLTPITFSGYDCNYSPYFLYKAQLYIPKYDGFFINEDKSKLLVALNNQLFCCDLNNVSSIHNYRQFNLIDNRIVNDISVDNPTNISSENTEKNGYFYNIINYNPEIKELSVYCSNRHIYRKIGNQIIGDFENQTKEVMFINPEYTVLSVVSEIALSSSLNDERGFNTPIIYRKNIYDEYNSMTVYDSSIIIDIIPSNTSSKVYIVFRNGTILIHDGDNNSASIKYNYTHGRHVISSYYDESHNNLLLLFHETASFNSRLILKKISLETGESYNIYTYNNNSNKIKAYPENNYLFLYSDNFISVYTYDTLSFITSIKASKDNYYEDIFYDKENNIIIVPFHNDSSYREFYLVGACILYKFNDGNKISSIGIYKIPCINQVALNDNIIIKKLYGEISKIIISAIDNSRPTNVIFESIDSHKNNIIVSTNSAIPVHIKDEDNQIIDSRILARFTNNVYVNGNDLLLKQTDNSFICLHNKHNEFLYKYNYQIKYSYSQINKLLYLYTKDFSCHIYSVNGLITKHLTSFTNIHPYRLTSLCNLYISNKQTQYY